VFILNVEPIRYSDPWIKPLEHRLTALAKGHKRVAYFYERADNSTFRYRVYNMVEVLKQSSRDISAAYFFECEIDHLDAVVDMADVLVICRARYTDKLNRIITRAQAKGKPVFFDVDDLVFDPDYIHLVLTTLDQDLKNSSVWDFWYAYVGRIGAILRMCDRAIVTNDYLASRLRHYVDKPVSIVPNFLNEEQMAISRRIFDEKQTRQFSRNEEIHLGYFSGTPTHNKDFAIVSDVLARLLENDHRLRVRVVGFLELKGPIQNYRSRIEFYPLSDFINLQRLIGEVEINLVPLQDNIFTHCKSELKYFEAGIAGTVTVASPTFTLENAIRDGENGFIANAFQWDEKLQCLLGNMDSYPLMAAKAFAHSEQNYCWENQVKLVETTLFN
jgi:glycosyltransferase involved in cell wall biosynthesis